MSTTTEIEPASQKALRLAAERFEAETAEHKMTILHDDGPYRHLTFRGSPNWAYWFDLITVPHALIFRGDYESHVFSRVEDMFGFFRSNPDRVTHRINPGYWAEKLTSDRDCAKAYSEDVFNEYVAQELAEAEERWPGITAAWAEHAGEDNYDYDLSYEEAARQALNDFEYAIKGRKETLCFEDSWEADFKDFDHGYLWACHAIVAGIAQYDAAKAAAAKQVVGAGAVA